MCECCFRAVANVELDLIPVTLIISDLLASRTNRKQSTQRFYLRKGGLQLSHETCRFWQQTV